HPDCNGYRGVSDPPDHGAAHRDGAEPELHDLGEPEQSESGTGHEWLEHHFDDRARNYTHEQHARVQHVARATRLLHSDVHQCGRHCDAEPVPLHDALPILHPDCNGYRGVSDPPDHGAAHRDGAEPELHDLGEPEQSESATGHEWLEHHFDD